MKTLEQTISGSRTRHAGGNPYLGSREPAPHFSNDDEQAGGELSNTEKLMFAKAATQSVQGILDDVHASSRPNDDTIVLMDLNRRSHSPMEHFTQNAVNVCVYAPGSA
ncbi:hypothetical protein RAC89_14095 [Paenibacillus sp. GD4]|uniref:hypothetical protein n=1 Tax=Paenibacillus sp. GD4 TaxID=3068890 RepID=UPI002796E22A|nr:hypothetical protein [Paenibacillus sp. GD4]MDQ1911558.1 hypothetical protein [Paenibacillus sp. GD4]